VSPNKNGPQSSNSELVAPKELVAFSNYGIPRTARPELEPLAFTPWASLTALLWSLIRMVDAVEAFADS
jgi:hypothetical protein